MNKIIKSMGNFFFRGLGFYPVKINNLKYKCDPYHIGFWRKVSKGRWEPNTFKIFSTFLNKNINYCDIGAWIGPTVIYAASICKKVVCFEPDPIAFKYLIWNIEVNNLTNIFPLNIALSNNNFSILKMGSRGLGNSMTSLLNADKQEYTIDVLSMMWQSWCDIYGSDLFHFIKVDIEGGEFDLLPTMTDYLAKNKPIVYLSTHPQILTAKDQSEKMQNLFEVMKIYRRCLSEDLRPLDISKLPIDKAGSYLFLD
jgi:FkbM family methyltransferase